MSARLSPERYKILLELRHGALDKWQIAASTGLSPFQVRAELRALERQHLVTERIRSTGRMFELADRGLELAWAPHQTELDR